MGSEGETGLEVYRCYDKGQAISKNICFPDVVIFVPFFTLFKSEICCDVFCYLNKYLLSCLFCVLFLKESPLNYTSLGLI